jgi:polyphosphate kinase
LKIQPLTQPAASFATPGLHFNNRYLSWLAFNSRVLDEAIDSRTPLLERVRFMQIFTTNLDEFFMKRVGFLKRQQALGLEDVDSSGMTTQETLSEVRKLVLDMLQRQGECWNSVLSRQLEREGILILHWSDLFPEEQEELHAYFEDKLFPLLTPLAVDSGHPFPFISNLSSSLGVMLRSQVPDRFPSRYRPEDSFARVKIPTDVPGLIRLKGRSSDPNEARFIFLREVIEHFIDRLFPGMDIVGTMPFSITRNSEVQQDEEDAEDLMQLVSEALRERRFAKVVRLEHGPAPIPELQSFLIRELELTDNDVYPLHPSVDFAALDPVCELNRKELRFRRWAPLPPERLSDPQVSIFSAVREQDLLVHHPYESFHQTVERFIRTACDDPKVRAIKMVLYRTGAQNPFIPLLMRAAESGKQVICIVEIKASFDEERNIQVAKALEKSGVHVVYGMVGLKTHCKAILVVREEGNEMRSYAHLSTGNYNPLTANLYTDFGLFTAKPEYTRDLSHLFNHLTGRSRVQSYRRLLVAPVGMKDRIIELIHGEQRTAASGKPARIVAKMNSLEDRDVIEALYAASAAGVQIDLIVRGVCCLRPQVPGLSDNIRIVSIVGRFLEHSRIFYFQQGATEPLDGKFYIGSADWMRRNLSFRVEALAEVEDATLRGRLWEFMNICLNDRRQAWDILPDGSSQRREPRNSAEEEGTHDKLMKLYESVQSNSVLSFHPTK